MVYIGTLALLMQEPLLLLWLAEVLRIKEKNLDD